MSVERNVSLPGRGQEPRTPPNSGNGPSLFVLVDGDFVGVDQQGLKALFKRRQNDVTQARLRAAAARKWVRNERSADRRARRRLEKEMREWDRAGNRRVRIRAARPDAETQELERQQQRARSASITPLTKLPRALPKYGFAIVDKAGRRGVFVDFVYDSAARNRFGVARRRVEYMFKDDHAELINGQVRYRSNLGESYGEILAAVNVAETANRSARKNAKVGTNAIYQFAADLDQPGRLRAMDLLAAKYEAIGLAYVMVPHMPSPGSDERNFHVHVWSTTRPMERIAPYEWAIGQQLRTDCDGPDALYDLRRTWAEICTKVSHERGQRNRYTHLGNAERGLANRPQRRLNPRQVENWRKGEHEEAVAAMQKEIADNEALVAEIKGRKSHAYSEAARTELPNLDRSEITITGSRSEPARTIGIGEMPPSVRSMDMTKDSSAVRAASSFQQSIPVPANVTITAAAPTLAGTADAHHLPPAQEKVPQLGPFPFTKPATHVVPTASTSGNKRIAQTSSPKTHPRMSPRSPTSMVPSMSASISVTPNHVTKTVERRVLRTVEATQRSPGAPLTPVSTPRPIVLTPAGSAPSKISITASQKYPTPPVSEAQSHAAVVPVSPISLPARPALKPTELPQVRPVLKPTLNMTITPLQPTTSPIAPQLSPVGVSPVLVLNTTAPDLDRVGRDDFARRLRLERASLGLAMQGLKLAIIGERLAYGHAARDDEHALLDQASLEVFAVDPAASAHARNTIGRYVALYIEREDSSDLLTLETASGAASGNLEGKSAQTVEPDAIIGAPDVQPAEVRRMSPPTGTADTSGESGGLEISASNRSGSGSGSSDEQQVTRPDTNSAHPKVQPGSFGGMPDGLELFMKRLRKQRRLIRKVGHRFELPADLLSESGLPPQSLTTPTAQDLLEAEYLQQRNDLRRLARHLTARPSDLYAVTNGWRAHHDVPRDIREQLDLWLGEPIVQAALSKLVTMDEVERDSAEYKQRVNLLRKQIYHGSGEKPPTQGGDRAAALGAAVTTAQAEPKAQKETLGRSRSPNAAPHAPGKQFPGFDLGR